MYQLREWNHLEVMAWNWHQDVLTKQIRNGCSTGTSSAATRFSDGAGAGSIVVVFCCCPSSGLPMHVVFFCFSFNVFPKNMAPALKILKYINHTKPQITTWKSQRYSHYGWTFQCSSTSMLFVAARGFSTLMAVWHLPWLQNHLVGLVGLVKQIASS